MAKVCEQAGVVRRVSVRVTLYHARAARQAFVFGVLAFALGCGASFSVARAADNWAVEAGAPAVRGSSGARAPIQDVRKLPAARQWRPGDPIIEMPSRVRRASRTTAPEALGETAVVERRALLPDIFVRRLEVDGTSFTGVLPPDTTGQVGPNHYIQAVNSSNGSTVRIIRKNGNLAAPPFQMSSLFPDVTDACSTDPRGDPVVVFDYQASRWIMLEFVNPGAGNRLCLYISNNGNPVSGGWNGYALPTPEFPDYPKLGVAPRANAYVITVNDSQQRVFAIRRSSALAGAATLPTVTFTFTPLSGFSFQSLTPATVASATLPPQGTPAIIARHRDTEAHGGAAPAGRDLIELFELTPNFNNPPASTVVAKVARVPDFDSAICGLFTLDCVPQPGTAQRLDPLREVIMQPLQYRRNGQAKSLVGSFTVDGDGNDLAIPYWFELRRQDSGRWDFRQGGPFFPNKQVHRWLPSIGIDKQGNIAMGFNTSAGGNGKFPSSFITGRLASDPLNTLRVPQSLRQGAASQTIGNRWGDYAAVTVDPEDDCTFWFTTEHIPAGGLWATAIGAYRFPGCT